MSAKWDRSWTRIGRYDRALRRSTWVRLVAVEGPPWLLEEHNVQAIELCSGREGDDAYALIEPSNPAYEALLDVCLTAVGNVEDEPEAHEWYDDEQPAAPDGGEGR